MLVNSLGYCSAVVLPRMHILLMRKDSDNCNSLASAIRKEFLASKEQQALRLNESTSCSSFNTVTVSSPQLRAGLAEVFLNEHSAYICPSATAIQSNITKDLSGSDELVKQFPPPTSLPPMQSKSNLEWATTHADTMCLLPTAIVLIDLGDVLIVRVGDQVVNNLLSSSEFPEIKTSRESRKAVGVPISVDAKLIPAIRQDVVLENRSAVDLDEVRAVDAHVHSLITEEVTSICNLMLSREASAKRRDPPPIVKVVKSNNDFASRMSFSRLSPSHMMGKEQFINSCEEFYRYTSFKQDSLRSSLDFGISDVDADSMIRVAPVTDQPHFQKFLAMAALEYSAYLISAQNLHENVNNRPPKPLFMNRYVFEEEKRFEDVNPPPINDDFNYTQNVSIDYVEDIGQKVTKKLQTERLSDNSVYDPEMIAHLSQSNSFMQR